MIKLETNAPTATIISAVALALGLMLAGFFVSKTLYNSKVAANTAEAKGLAERRVEADRANWTISFSLSGKHSAFKVSDLYAKMEAQSQRIVEVLKEAGFQQHEIEVGIIDYYTQEFRNKEQVLVDRTHQLNGSISIDTEHVHLIEKARAPINKLITEGIYISNQPPAYHFTKLNDIKTDMLKEAALNARLAASQFAENAGARVGGIRSARQGGFNITDAGQEYGDTKKIEKDVRVVTTINFYIVD